MNYKAPPAFSLTTSLKKSISEMPKREHVSPGPIYDYQKGTISGIRRSFSIGKSERIQINHGVEQTPSPDHYKIKQKQVKNQISFPKYQPINPENELDPFGYHHPNHQLTQPKLPTYSMGQKYPSILTNSNHNPGPGSYQVNNQSLPILNKSKNKSQNKFASASRFKNIYETTPGVGNYNLQTMSKLMNKKTSLPQEKKFRLSKQLQPARMLTVYQAGDYLVKSQFSDKGQKGKSFSLRFKSPFQVKSDTFATFGKYFQNQGSRSVLQKSVKYTFPKEKRQIAPKDNIPAPTEYINDVFKQKNTPSVMMAQSQRKEYNDTLEFPGPGSYQIKNQSGKKATIGRSKSISHLSETPGPGRYEPKISRKIPKGAIFGSQKKGVVKIYQRGTVGAYQLSQSLLSKKGSFSKSQRFCYQIERQPGPGDYHIQDIINYHLTAKKSSLKEL